MSDQKSDRRLQGTEALWVNGRSLEPLVEQMLGAMRSAFEVQVDGPKLINADAVGHWCNRLREILSEANTGSGS